MHKRSNRKIERNHYMLAATLVALGHNMALPLMPEFTAPLSAAILSVDRRPDPAAILRLMRKN